MTEFIPGGKMTPDEARQVPIASLAYLGDCVMELVVRSMLIKEGGSHPSERSHEYVTASAQYDAAEKVLPCLEEDEKDVFMRGRNNVHTKVPRNSTPKFYRTATALECLFAYLYLTGRNDRICELFRIGYKEETKEEE